MGVTNPQGIEKMRAAGKLASEVLAFAGTLVKVRHVVHAVLKEVSTGFPKSLVSALGLWVWYSTALALAYVHEESYVHTDIVHFGFL